MMSNQMDVSHEAITWNKKLKDQIQPRIKHSLGDKKKLEGYSKQRDTGWVNEDILSQIKLNLSRCFLEKWLTFKSDFDYDTGIFNVRCQVKEIQECSGSK